MKRISSSAFKESFILSNVSPQVGNIQKKWLKHNCFSLGGVNFPVFTAQVGIGFNRHYWARLEEFSRNLVRYSFNELLIVSGMQRIIEQCANAKYIKFRLIWFAAADLFGCWLN